LDFIYIIKAIILAIVEGITEFIPVSSTGHMILVGDIIKFGDSDFSNFFEVFIQAGAILAIVVLFRKTIWEILVSFFKWEKRGKSFILALVVGSIPAVILGVLFDDFIDEHLFNSWTVLIGLFVGAIFLLLSEIFFRKNEGLEEVEDIGWKRALAVGCFQCLSLWPGMSRSSSTISGGWISGLTSKAAAEFSFFLAIPIMFGAAGFKSIKFVAKGGMSSVGSTEAVALALGFVLAFVVALLCVKAFIAFISKRPMKYFAYYRIGLSIVFAGLLLLDII